MRVLRSTAIGGLVLATALLAGCSTSSNLDNAALQEKIAGGISEQVGGEWTVVCPADEPIKQGATFDCTATGADGTPVTITVTQDDDQGNITWATND